MIGAKETFEFEKVLHFFLFRLYLITYEIVHTAEQTLIFCFIGFGWAKNIRQKNQSNKVLAGLHTTNSVRNPITTLLAQP